MTGAQIRPENITHGGRHPVHVIVPHGGEQGQRDDAGADPFRMGEIAFRNPISR